VIQDWQEGGEAEEMAGMHRAHEKVLVYMDCYD